MQLDEMAASSKFDLPASPDRPLDSIGQCGFIAGASFDRSGSFRESIENPILLSLSSMPKSSSVVTQDDVRRFFQCLSFDPNSVGADNKFYRHGELKRILSTPLGISRDDFLSASLKGRLLSSSPEELKKAKAVMRENISKARERLKIFGEALSVFNKYFPNLPSRKRSRMDLMSGGQPSAVTSTDQPGFNPSLGKMGTSTPSHGNSLEVEQVRPEEKIKSFIIGKRTRTSLLDSRENSIARPSMLVDKDKDALRVASSDAELIEDQSLSIGIDSWEKSKMKKRRSGIKPDVSPSKLTNKPIEGLREPKQGMQQRPITDIRSRLNVSRRFRPGVGNEVVGAGKPDGILQQNGSTVRSSFCRSDQENNYVAWDKKECQTASDKERVNLKAVNQNSSREDYCSVSPTSSTKVPASVRAPRSGTGVFSKLSTTLPRQSASSDWEISQSVERPSTSVGATNLNRTHLAQCSSPPVAHWAGQRPHKISRTARRTKFLPIVSNNDDSPALDNDSGSVARNFHSSSPQQVKLKGDNSSAALTESEESGLAEIKVKDMKKMFDEVDYKSDQNVQKGSPTVLPPRKNKFINGENFGDVCKQGRSGHGSAPTRSLMPTTFEKLGNVGTAKQMRTSKIGYDRTESKAGRPPTRKISDRRFYTRFKHSSVAVAVEFPGPGDGQSELLAAANAIFIPSQESSFWRLMEPMLGFISEADTAFLKQQEDCIPALFLATPASTDSYNCDFPANGLGLGTETVDPCLEPLTLEPRGHVAIPLCQRLISALITEEDIEGYSHGPIEGIQLNDFGKEFLLDNELECGALHCGLLGSLHTKGTAALNGIRITAVKRTLGEMEGYDEPAPASRLASIQNSETILNLSLSVNQLLPEPEIMSNMVNQEYHYGNLSIEERLLFEIQGIGISTKQMEVQRTENDEISQDIRRLAGTYCEQVSRKKGVVNNLSKLASETRECQEKVYEQCALEKLVIMAYGKYMCWDGSSAMKNNVSTTARQAALPFVRRILEHCRKYEATGISCFSDPIFKDIFASGTARLAEARSLNAITECQIDQTMEKHDVYSTSAVGKEDLWSNKVKKRELLLDDVGSNIVSSSGPPGSFSGNAEGRRTDRDREGKGKIRDGLSRNGACRPGRPAGGNAKGGRKSKAKPKQKTAQLSTSFNGLLEKSSEQHSALFPSVPRSSNNTTDNSKSEKDDFCLELDDPELQLPGIDIGLGGQGQDLGSWLNIDDDGLQDLDFMGLEIPMDDLTNINMMV